MTNASTPVEPVEVRAPRGAETTEIHWSDGTVTVLSNELMRGYCPCAGCQGHSSTIAYRHGGNPEIDSISEVGNYALCFRWGDGHDSGIYTWDYLRRLGQHVEQSGRDGVMRR
jgi:DUF971 family protein